MKPKALTTLKFVDARTPQEKHEQRMAMLGPLAQRYGLYPKGTVLPETQVVACPRSKVSDFPAGWLPQYLFDRVEQDQKIASCCRHPENHEIEARKSHPDEPAPDIYVLYCTCGRKHRRLIGAKFDRAEGRPYWE